MSIQAIRRQLRNAKRELALTKSAWRKRMAKRHDKQVRKLGTQRNKSLRDAERAVEKATALEEKRKAEAKLSAALAPIKAEKLRKRKARRAKAKRILGGIDKSTKSLRGDLKKGVKSAFKVTKKEVKKRRK